jgi:hypothetical protein
MNLHYIFCAFSLLLFAGTPAVIYAPIFLIYIVANFFIYHRSVLMLRTNSYIVFGLLLAVMIYFISFNGMENLDNRFATGLIVIVSIIAIELIFRKYEPVDLLRFFSYGVILSNAPHILFSIAGSPEVVYGKLTNIYTGEPIYTSHLTTYLTISAVILLPINDKLDNFKKWINLALIALCFLFATILAGRTFFLVMAILLFLTSFRKYKFLIQSIIALIITFIFLKSQFDDYLSYILLRFSDFGAENNDQITRSALWVNALSETIQSPFGGWSVYGDENFSSTHNMIFDSLRFIGWIAIIPLVILFRLVFENLIKIKKMSNEQYHIFLIILSLFLTMMAESIWEGLYKLFILYVVMASYFSYITWNKVLDKSLR